MTDLTTYHEEVGGMVEGPALFDGQEEWVKASEAADLITALEAEIARKDAALALCAKHVNWMPHPHCVEVEAAIRAALSASEIVKGMCGGN